MVKKIMELGREYRQKVEQNADVQERRIDETIEKNLTDLLTGSFITGSIFISPHQLSQDVCELLKQRYSKTNPEFTVGYYPTGTEEYTFYFKRKEEDTD